MKVVAIKRGFFGGQYRKVGDEFDCPEKEMSKIWMKKVSGKKTKAKAKEEPKQEVKRAEDVEHEPLEIPSLMPEFAPKED